MRDFSGELRTVDMNRLLKVVWARAGGRGSCEPRHLNYQISLSPSCIWRLPPVNRLSFRNKSEITLEYVVLSALFTVPISTPVWKTVGWASEKLRWLKVLNVSTRNCKVALSVSFVFLNSPMFHILIPGLPKLLRPTVGKAPSSACTYRALGFCAT